MSNSIEAAFVKAMKSFVFGTAMRTMRISGNSMAPLLNEGDEIAIVSLDNRRLRKGRCYIYCAQSGMLILHRFVGWKGPKAVFHGDNTYGFEIVDPTSVIGTIADNGRALGIRLLALFDAIFYPLFGQQLFMLRLRRRILSMVWRAKRRPQDERKVREAKHRVV